MRRIAVALAPLLMVLGGLSLSSPAPATAAVPPDPFYGVWYDGLSPTAAEARGQMDDQVTTGVGLVRQYVFWDRIETSPGTFDWSRFDQLVTDATARGQTILPTLLYVPAFYTSQQPGAPAGNYPPADPQTLARFATEMVKRYGPRGTYWCTPSPVPGLPPTCKKPTVPIRAWEIWNEPNNKGWWRPEPDVDQYARMLDVVSRAIHTADAGAEVVLGSLYNRGIEAGGYMEQLYALGAGADFDTLSMNPYGYDVRDMVDQTRVLRDIAARNGDAAKPLRITEYGWATGGRSDNIVVDEPCQAGLMYAATKRWTQLKDELKIKSIISFQWSDVDIPGTTAWPHFAGLRRVDDTDKPAMAAQAAAIAGQPAPPGAALTEGCPAERRTDGVYRDAVRADAPLSYLRLGDAVGSTAAADDRGARPGTYRGTKTLGATSALAHDTNPSVTLPNGGSAVDLGKGPLLLGRAATTVEGWVKTSAKAVQVVYQERLPGAAGMVRVDLAGGAASPLRLQFQEPVKGAPVQVVRGTKRLNDGVWHHVVVTRSGTAVQMYVDGVLDTSGTLTSAVSTAAPAAAKVALGRDLVLSRDGIRGGLDEVALYPTALTPARVAAHWAVR